MVRLTDGRTGRVSRFVVAGLLDDATAFYGIDPGQQRWPVIMSVPAVTAAFGPAAAPGSALVRTAPGTDLAALRASLQGSLLGHGVVVTDLRERVEASYTANRQLFRLMQGYLALGLLVGITGLGVLMVRAVRERRRTIGVLRALGVRATTVRRSFLAESTFIAVEGVVIGTVLGRRDDVGALHEQPRVRDALGAVPRSPGSRSPSRSARPWPLRSW